MDNSEYLRLLSEASINDSSKFRAAPFERPSSKGRPTIYYHPVLQKEKELASIVRRILPKPIADTCALQALWFTKDTQGSIGDAPHTIINANIQLRFGKMARH